MATKDQIDRLRLSPRAKAGAVLLNERHPNVIFTSGYRDLPKQAEVMAHNTMSNPKWVGQTYKIGAELQEAIDYIFKSVSAPSEQLVKSVIFDYMAAQTDAWRAGLSRHLAGYAFDIMPVVDRDLIPTSDGWRIIEFCRLHIGAEKVLLREGGQVIWHVQFTPSEEV